MSVTGVVATSAPAPGARRSYTRRRRRGPLAPALCALLWLALVARAAGLAGAPAHAVLADGGAPNVAYTVGAGRGGGDLVAIDIARRQVIWRLAVGGDPRAVLLSADGRFAYIAQAAANAIAIVDASTRQLAGTIPTGQGPDALAIDSTATGFLYVANAGSDTVMAVDPGARSVVATIPVGQRPVSIAIAGPGSGITAPNDAEMYVANSGGDTISVVSTEHSAVIATLPAPGGPLAVVIPATGGIAYVGTRAGTVLAYSLADHRLLGALLQLRGSAAGVMDYDGVTGQIYVPDAASGTLDVLRPATAGSAGAPSSLPAEPARTLAIAGGPAAVAITVDGAYGFVAERDAGRVAQFDVATRAILATFAVGGGPRAIITGAYPPGGALPTGNQPIPPPAGPQAHPFPLLADLLFAGLGVALLASAIVALRYRQRVVKRRRTT
ncbi:MAG TPA: YncE family protein [Ktedonobacterales bacterium]|nr:YncE family protein [Ktedonobacterales bacterium]